MASRKAQLFLESNGIYLEHTDVEQSNFATGTGHGPNAMPFHVVETDTRYGSSKRTIGWAATIDDARSIRDGAARGRADADEFGRGGAEWIPGRRFEHYIRDIRTDETVA